MWRCYKFFPLLGFGRQHPWRQWKFIEFRLTFSEEIFLFPLRLLTQPSSSWQHPLFLRFRLKFSCFLIHFHCGARVLSWFIVLSPFRWWDHDLYKDRFSSIKSLFVLFMMSNQCLFICDSQSFYYWSFWGSTDHVSCITLYLKFLYRSPSHFQVFFISKSQNRVWMGEISGVQNFFILN